MRPCVRPCTFCSKTAHGIFLKFVIKLGLCKGQKLTRPDFLKKFRFCGEGGFFVKKWPKMPKITFFWQFLLELVRDESEKLMGTLRDLD